MVTTGDTSERPAGSSAADRLFALVAVLVPSALAAGTLTALVVGVLLTDVTLFCWSLGGVLVAVLLMAVPARVRRRRRGRPAPRIALARIENRWVTHGEFADVPVRFDLTVAPDDAPAYRVIISEPVDLVDLADWPEGRTVVVTYDDGDPWRVELDRRPTEEWARRAAREQVGTAPERTRVKETKAGCACSAVLLGLVAGALLVLHPYWSDLKSRYGDDPPAPGATGPVVPGPGSGSRSGSTTVTTVTGSASSPSTLRTGEMRRLANTLVTGMGTETGTRITIEEKVMSAVGSKDSTADEGFPMSLRALPYELLPGLVDTARTGLGIDAPASWRIDITTEGAGPAPVVRVTVSGHGKSAYLLADAVGRITERHPA
ncbi:hypothetical protein [Streptomyces sp. NPDC002690]